MATKVLTVIGADRAGLVQTLADVVAAHDGNWERSQLAELAGLFAGIVVIEVPDARADALVAALEGLDALHVGVHEAGADADVRTPVTEAGEVVTVALLGNDRPGIVKELSGVFARHGVSIEELTTEVRDAPMSGGRLFEAHVAAPLPVGADLEALRADLERLAAELMVDVTLGDPDH